VGLARVGSLPVAAINIGLAGSIAGITAKAAKLQGDATKLIPAIVGQLQIAASFPPNPASYGAAIGVALNPVELAAVCNPVAMAAASPDLLIDIATDLAVVSVQLAIVEKLKAQFSAGLEVGSIAGWSYSGPAPGFGSELARYTATGFGTTAPDAIVQACNIATENLDSWKAFSKSVNTGGSANNPADAARLAYLGELPAGRWNSGVADLAAGLDLLVADLRGTKSGLEYSAQVAVGLVLPDIEAVVDAGIGIFTEVGIDGLLENMISVQADFTGAIGAITGQIAATLALGADIAGQLSAGGLTFWTYSGRADGLGAALAAELQSGIPGGTGPRAGAYGLALAGTPAAMLGFGAIFKTS
jgi:hypothetical protein